VIIPGKWLINTSWAVEVQKKWLHRCAGKGRNAQMLKDKMNKILDNMRKFFKVYMIIIIDVSQ